MNRYYMIIIMIVVLPFQVYAAEKPVPHNIDELIPTEVMQESAQKKELVKRFFKAIRNNNVEHMITMMDDSPCLDGCYGQPKAFLTEVTAMHVAAAYGHLECLNALCKNNRHHCSLLDGLGNTPLHYTQDCKCAQLLVSSGVVSLSSKNNKGRTPFMCLVLNKRDILERKMRSSDEKRYATAEWILSCNQDEVNTVDAQHKSCLYHAVSDRIWSAIEFLLRNGAHAATRSNVGEKSPFVMALEGAGAAYLFEQYGLLFISAGDKSYNNPFITLRNNAEYLRQLVACDDQSAEVKQAVNGIARLLKCGESARKKQPSHDTGIRCNKDGWYVITPCIKDLQLFFGKSVISYALECVHKKYLQGLYIFGADSKTLLQQYLKDYPFLVEWDGIEKMLMFKKALTLGNHECLKMILDCYYDSSRVVNGVLESGEKPLLYAIDRDDAQTVALLIEYGADYMKRIKYFMYPYKYACQEKKEKSKVILNKKLCGDLDQALYGDRYEDVVDLLKQGLNLNVFNDDYNGTVLGNAIEHSGKKNKLTYCRMLIDAGAHVNMCDQEGYCPLYYAVLDKVSTDLCKLLLDAGAFASKKAPNGHSPFTLALLNDQNDLVQLFANYQSTPLIKTQMIAEASEGPIRALLQKIYDEQSCCVCLERPQEIKVIPCNSYHQNSFMCKECFEKVKVQNNTCPCCRGPLGEWKKKK